MEELTKENVLKFWEKASIEQQIENIDGVIELIDSQQVVDMWKLTKNQVKCQNPNLIIKIIKEKLDNGQTYISGLWKNTPSEVQEQTIEEVLTLYKNRLIISKLLIETNDLVKELKKEVLIRVLNKFTKFKLDVASLELLKGNISPEVSIELVIRNASELTIEKLEELSESFNITRIQILDENNSLDYHRSTPYDVEIYIKCRQVIDELLDGIDLSQQSDNQDREKIIFGQVIKRLANHISYDYETLKKLDDKIATDEEMTRCANMVGGLLNKTCVCSGYAEIVRNVFSCCGIEVRYISGNNIEPGEAGHAWNQIKLDGIWYNMDLTWDRDGIIDGQILQYLLKSDSDFKDHDKYNTQSCKMEKCRESVSYNDIKWYIYKILEIPKTIDTSVRRVRRRRVDRAYDMIATSQKTELTNPEKREEQWTN